DPLDRAEPRHGHGNCRAPAHDGRRLDRGRDHRHGALERYGAPEALPRRRAARRGTSLSTVVLLGTLDTKGREYAFLRERLRERGVDVLVVDAGVHAPVALEPDVNRDEVARAAGADAAGLAAAGGPGVARARGGGSAH